MIGARQPEAGGPVGTRGTARASAALSLLLAFAGGSFASAAGLHACPQHRHHAPPRGADPAGRAEARDGDAAGQPSRDDERSGRTCTCLGDCQTGAPGALHRPAVHDVFEPGTVAQIRRAGFPSLSPLSRSDYFLPYPLGPPAA